MSGGNRLHLGPDNEAAMGDRYRCGKLVYTKAGLFTLFTWLLWGDFCFSLMEAIWPNVLPLILKAEGASNVIMALVITTIPSAMNFVLNPIISTASDRYRGKRGRRVPFLLFATPFVTLFLILLGFSRELGALLNQILLKTAPNLAGPAVVISLICVLLICFRFFELFVNTVFWYLFNDVVPTAFMGRFLGFFRVIGSLAGALFNFFLFKYAESHTSMIFFGVAVLYGVAFMMMCLNVKEGTYPPPDDMRKGSRSPLKFVTTFFKECFSHRMFRLVFIYSAIWSVAGSINAFMIFMVFSIGLTLEDIGKIAGVAGIVGMLLMYPMGVLVDRYHPIRVMLVAQIGFCVVMSLNLVFLFRDFSKATAFWIYAGATCLAVPVYVANASAALPMYMRIFPHERFGQFCAANAMCAAFGTMLGGVSAGFFLDLVKRVSPPGDFYYRFAPVWSVLFLSLTLVATCLVYREWKKLGGDKNYRPPIADRFSQFYETEAKEGL